MPIQLLLVEDNNELAGSLGDYLTEVGFEVDYAFNGESCLELSKTNKYDVIVMDIVMPIKDGISTCTELRDSLRIRTPIIFITAKNSLNDKIEGFNSGADDYLVKPFDPEELVCRINALIKRGDLQSSYEQELGELTIDHQLCQVLRNDKIIELKNIEFKILIKLAKHAPEPVSVVTMEDYLWPEGKPSSDPLRVYIYRLRQKLDKPFNTDLLKSVHGKGYRLAIPR